MANWKTHALSIVRALGAFRLAQWMTRRKLRILCYHGIWLNTGAPNPFNFLYMSDETFTARMAALKRLGYPVLPLNEALRRLDEGTLPDNAVVITIDDGWVGTHTYMVPELKRHGFPATIYYTTYHAQTQTAVFGVALNYLLQSAPAHQVDLAALVPNTGITDITNAASRDEAHRAISSFAETLPAHERDTLLRALAAKLNVDWGEFESLRSFSLMSLEEARESAGNGVDFQLHTHRHRVSHQGRCCIAKELADNRAVLAQIGASETRHFCYPSGRWRPENFPALQAANVISATTTETGFCDNASRRLALPRILDGERLSELEFEAELSGLLEIKRRLIRFLRRQTAQP